MSSVVNKSGTRFAPKVRQRRAAGVAPPTARPTGIVPPKETIIDVPPEQKGTEASQGSQSAMDEASTLVASQPPLAKNVELEGPLSKSTQDTVPDTIAPSPHEGRSDSITSLGKPQRRLSRLPSLSSTMGSPLLKPSFGEPKNNGRRLSTISKPERKRPNNINKLLSERNDDATLNAIKKRRLSRSSRNSAGSLSSASRRAKTGRRISVVSKIILPTQANSDDEDKDTESNNAQGTSGSAEDKDGDDYFETYYVRSVTEVPKDIDITDSARYLVDEENFTMEELCKPTLHIGEISENYERARMADKQKLIKRKERRALRKRAREEFRSLQSLNKEEEELEKEKRKKKREELLNAEIPENGAPKGQQMQLKIGADGKMIIDEESTIVDRHKNANLENSQKEKVDENPFENLYNNASYGKNTYTDVWTPDEIIKMYKALAMWGTDFNLISEMFPYRTRRQVKAKFHKEEQKHPVMIELALRAKLPPDFESYCGNIQRELGTVDEFNKKIEELQTLHQLNLEEIEKAKQTARLEDSNSHLDDDSDKKSSGGFKKKYLHTYRKAEVVLGTIDDVKKLRKINEDVKDEDEDEDVSGSDDEENDGEAEDEKDENEEDQAADQPENDVSNTDDNTDI